MPRTSSFALMLLAALIAVLPAGHAAAMTADEYLTDGNRLYYNDLYWAALLRYQQAADEGLDSAVLHYNMGVAHYRAGQLIRSRQAFERALEHPTLQIAARYNLGLVANALGDDAEALRWFRLVSTQQGNENIRELALAATARLEAERLNAGQGMLTAEQDENERPFTNLAFRMRIGFASDDNVFRSPNQNYVDLAAPGQPIVTPEPVSGNYVPLTLAAKYSINSLPFEGFYGAYRFAGRYYVDELLENGNEYLHEVSFGSDYRRKEGSRRREAYSSFKVALHDEIYFDPDDGSSRNVDGVEVDDRMNYLRYGPEITLRESHQRLSFGAKFKGQLWNYEETEALPEYDHEYFLLRLFTQYRFTTSSLIRVTAQGYSRRFGDRPAYDLDGEQRLGNPDIRYDYLDLGLRARQRIGDSFWFGIDVSRTDRTDQYVGYNDYSRDSFGVELHWQPGERFDFEASGVYRIYNYPNAFAFHDPNGGRKTQEAADMKISATMRLRKGLSLIAEAQYRETVSNDIRIQYERMQYLLGVRWER
jgi:tetratricopeptide (TPR) repeat protein